MTAYEKEVRKLCDEGYPYITKKDSDRKKLSPRRGRLLIAAVAIIIFLYIIVSTVPAQKQLDSLTGTNTVQDTVLTRNI